MKKTVKTRVNKSVVALAEYKAKVIEYFNSVGSRQSVEHSRTPSIVTREGKTGPANILVNELVTIVRTANKLDKLVVLGVNGNDLVVLLEDRVPAASYELFY
jgi:hypothetical protein